MSFGMIIDRAGLNRSLEQELFPSCDGASLEWPLVCGEFVLRRGGTIACAECEAVFRERRRNMATIEPCRPGDREPFSGSEESPDTERAGRWGNPRRRKPTKEGCHREKGRPPAAKHSPETLLSGRLLEGKGETVE